MRTRITIFTLLVTTFAAMNTHAQDIYQVDADVSSVTFKVSQLGIALVRGRVDDFEGTLVLEGDRLTKCDGIVGIPSLDTGIRARDKDLKSKNFFDAEDFPSMKIKSNQIVQDQDNITVQSYLTIRDVTKLIDFQGKLEREDGQTMDLTLVCKINRKDFGLGLNKVFEFFVGNKVSISLKLRAVQKAPQTAHEKDVSFLKRG